MDSVLLVKQLRSAAVAVTVMVDAAVATMVEEEAMVEAMEEEEVTMVAEDLGVDVVTTAGKRT